MISDVIIILVYLSHRDFERNHGYRLIKVWLFVLTLRLFRSQVQSFSQWLRFVITPILSTVITVLSVKSFLITTSFFAVMTSWSHRDHGQTFLATTTKVVSVITPWSQRDHGQTFLATTTNFFSVITGQKFLPVITHCDHARDHAYIFTGDVPGENPQSQLEIAWNSIHIQHL